MDLAEVVQKTKEGWIPPFWPAMDPAGKVHPNGTLVAGRFDDHTTSVYIMAGGWPRELPAHLKLESLCGDFEILESEE